MRSPVSVTCDKLLLAFGAFAISQVCGKTPQVVRIIHGGQYTMLTVPLAALLHRVRLVLRSIADQQAKSTTPLLALNKHCAQCEFQVRCRQIAIQKDDLSQTGYPQDVAWGPAIRFVYWSAE
jgi:predicted RecB family nuclease